MPRQLISSTPSRTKLRIVRCIASQVLSHLTFAGNPAHLTTCTVTIVSCPDKNYIISHFVVKSEVLKTVSNKFKFMKTYHDSMISTESVLEYYEKTNGAVQWTVFNQAFAAELCAGLPSEELRLLFFRIGTRVAHASPVPHCNTLKELQTAFNERLQTIGWGFSTLHEQGEHLHISHACSPLAVAFGATPGNEWTASFFEGVYQAWFDAQGVPAGLRVRAEEQASPSSSQIFLTFGRTPS